MDSQTRNALSGIIRVLEETAFSIRTLEAEAKDALYLKDDRESYKKKLYDKAQLLMELPECTEEFSDDLREDIAREIEDDMDDFARRAEQATELSSLFFMATLLYPEDYKEGNRNDLENYIEHLKKQFSMDKGC